MSAYFKVYGFFLLADVVWKSTQHPQDSGMVLLSHTGLLHFPCDWFRIDMTTTTWSRELLANCSHEVTSLAPGSNCWEDQRGWLKESESWKMPVGHQVHFILNTFVKQVAHFPSPSWHCPPPQMDMAFSKPSSPLSLDMYAHSITIRSQRNGSTWAIPFSILMHSALPTHALFIVEGSDRALGRESNDGTLCFMTPSKLVKDVWLSLGFILPICRHWCSTLWGSQPMCWEP